MWGQINAQEPLKWTSAFLTKIRTMRDFICLFPSSLLLFTTLSNPINLPPSTIPYHRLFTAPSPVIMIKKDRTSRNSISLSWQEPEHPNGIILDYEVKYYEKVGRLCEWIVLCGGKGFLLMICVLAKTPVTLLGSGRTV